MNTLLKTLAIIIFLAGCTTTSPPRDQTEPIRADTRKSKTVPEFDFSEDPDYPQLRKEFGLRHDFQQRCESGRPLASVNGHNYDVDSVNI